MKNIEIHKKYTVGMVGTYVFTKASVVTSEAKKLLKNIETMRDRGLDPIAYIRELNQKFACDRVEVKNIVPTVGRTMIANNLSSSSPTNTPYINIFAVGTGTNVPANGDTTLQTETYRNTPASRTNSSNVAYITGFLTATESTGTYRECGLFSNGVVGTPNSGVLVSRVAINITKGATETLTIDWTLTIN